jgi:hypothetical protein
MAVTTNRTQELALLLALGALTLLAGLRLL